jgi:hypothetical protein
MTNNDVADSREVLFQEDKYTFPRKETLAFLKQFARVYRVESKLNVGLSGLILN